MHFMKIKVILLNKLD